MNKTQNAFLKGILLAALLLSFTVLLAGGYGIFRAMAPRPLKVVDTHGNVLTTRAQIEGGQAVFQKYGLMDYGTVLGDGSYLGPDYTAEALKIYVEAMQNYEARQAYKKDFAQLSEDEKMVIRDKVIKELKQNRYDQSTEQLVLTDAESYGLQQIRATYVKIFTYGDGLGIAPHLIKDTDMPAQKRAWVAAGDQKRQLADFFFWTAWLAGTNRPGDTITYTNNWPFYEDAGNGMAFSAIWWSGVSITLLILFVGLILFIYHRYRLRMEEAYEPGKFPKIDIGRLRVAPSQVKAGKYLLIVTLLFLVQCFFGALLAHYYLEPTSFFGIKWIAELLPFSIAKSYHLQLAIFWIATAWLAMGIYIAPIVGGKEPKRQGLLVDILFWALIVLVGGVMVGEWLGINGKLGNGWFLFGHQGLEYLELGRAWQVVFAAGMLVWLYIVFRAIRRALRQEKDKAGLVHLLFYAAIAVPVFYLFAFLYNPGTHFTMADYWRWWIIHLWVEGIFEVFAVVIIGFLLVRMKLVTEKSTIRAMLFQITLLLGSGVIGIGHHYYYNGSPEIWIALGSVFSALEVIPLTLLILEAYEQYKIMKTGGKMFPYSASFRFLISTAIWNLIGAGVLGFLINLPSVNYFEHGQFLTPAHAHGAMMGVYGMFALAVLAYVLRNIVEPKEWREKWLKVSCLGLNIGLAGMIVITLLPVGFLQIKEAYEHGYWASRSAAFFTHPIVRELLWWRIIPDCIFIIVGILPLVYAVARSMFHLRKTDVKDGEEITEI
ncbi:MAG TPA: nitric-oxide reductase large subunit [Bacilli bacterium]